MAQVAGFKIFFVFEDERKNQVNNNRRAESEERKINEIQTYGFGFYAEFFAKPVADSENIELKKGL